MFRAVRVLEKVFSSRNVSGHFDPSYFNAIRFSSTSAVIKESNFNNYIPRRACMYVPANDWKKISKIPSMTKADCFILDCEDGVAINRKEEARNNIATYFRQHLNDSVNAESSVRINSVDSGFCEDDLKTIFSDSQNLPKTVLLPKVESKGQLDWFANKLNGVLKGNSKVNLIIYIESARSIIDMNQLCQHCFDLQEQGAPFYLDGAIFGSDDFCADIGATRSAEASELVWARQFFVTVAKAYGLQAIDLVYINYKNLDGLKTQSQEGFQWGYTGKQVIHPIQIETVQNAFTPSSEKIEWARQLIEAFDQHQQSGKGAFNFRGHMIDRPLLIQARNIIQMTSNFSMKK